MRRYRITGDGVIALPSGRPGIHESVGAVFPPERLESALSGVDRFPSDRPREAGESPADEVV